MAKGNRYLHLGWGLDACDYNKGDNYSVKEQTGFASFMTQQLDKYGVPFAIVADHHFYDYKSEQWIPKYKDLLNTIFM